MSELFHLLSAAVVVSVVSFICFPSCSCHWKSPICHTLNTTRPESQLMFHASRTLGDFPLFQHPMYVPYNQPPNELMWLWSSSCRRTYLLIITWSKKTFHRELYSDFCPIHSFSVVWIRFKIIINPNKLDFIIYASSYLSEIKESMLIKLLEFSWH